MSQDTFQKYGCLADSDLSFVVKSGRYRAQASAEPVLIRDIIEKLQLSPTDSFLEIGCGVGNLLIPLSFVVSSAMGIDHPKVISQLKKRFSDSKIKLEPIDFFDFSPKRNQKFNKILINSVLGALSNESAAIEFIDKAAHLLIPGGRLLVGDIANSDKKARFIATKYGKRFSENWSNNGKVPSAGEEEAEAAKILSGDTKMFLATDKFIISVMKLYRRQGWECYSLPQKESLPFGHTREDLLILKLPT